MVTFAEASWTEVALVVTAATGGIAVVIGAVASAIANIYIVRARLLQVQLAEKESNEKALKSMTNEAITVAEKAAVINAGLTGKPVPEALAAVVAEHNSPATETQQATADLATLRARMTAVAKLLGFKPRLPPQIVEDKSGEPDAQANADKQ